MLLELSKVEAALMTEGPLTDDELKAFRELLEAERRMKWLRSNLRVWSWYISGGILTGFALWKGISEYLSIKIGMR